MFSKCFLVSFADKRGLLENPTLELVDEVFNTSHKAFCMAVVAHEIGHLLGAPEVRCLGSWTLY